MWFLSCHVFSVFVFPFFKYSLTLQEEGKSWILDSCRFKTCSFCKTMVKVTCWFSWFCVCACAHEHSLALPSSLTNMCACARTHICRHMDTNQVVPKKLWSFNMRVCNVVIFVVVDFQILFHICVHMSCIWNTICKWTVTCMATTQNSEALNRHAPTSLHAGHSKRAQPTAS